MTDIQTLEQIVSTPTALVSFLQALAEVETAGATWILAVPPAAWNQEFHQHALDELRHAKLLRTLAQKIQLDGDLLSHTISVERYRLATETYLRKLFASCYRQVRKGAEVSEATPVHLYAGLALAVERRLMKIYPFLAKNAVQEDVRKLAAALIADEKNHLSLVTRIIHEKGFQEFADASVGVEETFAETWFGELV